MHSVTFHFHTYAFLFVSIEFVFGNSFHSLISLMLWNSLCFHSVHHVLFCVLPFLFYAPCVFLGSNLALFYSGQFEYLLVSCMLFLCLGSNYARFILMFCLTFFFVAVEGFTYLVCRNLWSVLPNLSIVFDTRMIDFLETWCNVHSRFLLFRARCFAENDRLWNLICLWLFIFLVQSALIIFVFVALVYCFPPLSFSISNSIIFLSFNSWARRYLDLCEIHCVSSSLSCTCFHFFCDILL